MPKRKRGYWVNLLNAVLPHPAPAIAAPASTTKKAKPKKEEVRKRRVSAGAGTRMYTNAINDRLTAGWGTANSSADSEILSSLQMLRSRSRALVRDAAYAKRAKTIVVNNVIGSGIGMQAQVGTTRADDTGAVKLNTRINSEIERVWDNWSCAEYCHTGGMLAFGDLERMMMGQIFEAGEVIVREHYTAFGDSPVPYALEVIEAEAHG